MRNQSTKASQLKQSDLAFYIYNLDKQLIFTAKSEQEAIDFIQSNTSIESKKQSKTSILQSFKNAIKGYKGYGYFKEYFVSKSKLSKKDFWSKSKQLSHFKQFINDNYESQKTRIGAMQFKNFGEFDEDVFVDTVIYCQQQFDKITGINSLTETLSCKYRFNMLDKFKKLNTITTKIQKGDIYVNYNSKSDREFGKYTVELDNLSDQSALDSIYNDVSESNSSEHSALELKNNLIHSTLMAKDNKLNAIDKEKQTKIFQILYKDEQSGQFVLQVLSKVKLNANNPKRTSSNGLKLILPNELTSNKELMDYLEELQVYHIVNCQKTPLNRVIFNLCFSMLESLLLSKESLIDSFKCEIDDIE